MLFGLTNTLASFQGIIDTIFKDTKGYIWYLDNIFIFDSNTEEEH